MRRAAGLPGYVRFASWDEFFDVLFSLRGYAVAFDEFSGSPRWPPRCRITAEVLGR